MASMSCRLASSKEGMVSPSGEMNWSEADIPGVQFLMIM
jgi:hypothetical protein